MLFGESLRYAHLVISLARDRMIVSHTMRVAAVERFRLWARVRHWHGIKLTSNSWHAVQGKVVVRERA